MDNKTDFINRIGLMPEIIDAVSHLQAAHASLEQLPGNLEKRDADLALEWKDVINDQLQEIGDMRHVLLSMMADIAACTWD